MSGLLIVFGVMAAFVILGMLASAWGVDSRDDSPDPRRPAYPVGIR